MTYVSLFRDWQSFCSARIRSNTQNFHDRLVERACHQFVHGLRLIALDEVGHPTATSEDLLELFVSDARASTAGLLI